jgi:hypothetical protein
LEIWQSKPASASVTEVDIGQSWCGDKGF